ncbi:MAG: HAD family phosphatase [Myxococcales bacterium]|jgi:HAD superfamily hydrolase (TIGR01509 family)|nr:HAD family phosphatase [Myxococcales bacterium]
MAVQAVCFDLDGTLVDSEGDCADGIERALAHIGRDLRPSERDFVVGHGAGEILAMLRRNGGVAWSEREFEDAVFSARKALLSERGVTILPGAREIVRDLAGRFPLALVTGSTRSEAELMLQALELAPCFAVTLCAGEYPRGKPAPDAYLQAADALRVAPTQCIAIEDSTPGIAAARTAGMSVVAVRAGNRYGQDQSAAHHLLDTLLELPALLAELSRAAVS